MVRSLLQIVHLGGRSGAAVIVKGSAMLSVPEPEVVIVFVYLSMAGIELL